MRIGTRASALALAQATWVADQIPGAELVTISKQGPVDDKSRWVSELERALLDGRIDIAVHSAKDVPSELPDGLELVAIPPRADPRDVVCGATSLAALAPGARVGTSSLRRAAQMKAIRPDIEVIELRGNVDTRLRKLADGEYDAIVVALAGLQRLGRAGEAGGVLDELVPAAGQGALAIEAKAGIRVGLADPQATACVTAERALVRVLGASCHTSVGARASISDKHTITLTGWVGAVDGSVWLRDELTGDEPEGLGTEVARRMLAAGARDLL